MQLACAHCHEILEFTEKRPSFCAHCGKPFTDPSPFAQSTADLDPEAPTQAPGPRGADVDTADPTAVGPYRLLRQLGEGGMGRVYEAEDSATGRHVALKLIGRNYTSSPDAVERFRREGRLASALSHPRCVFVMAADEEGGRPYIVMELMPGDTLQDLIKRQGPLPVDQALAKILDVIEGLQEAHRLGMVHRDVKPSNCFLEPDGRVKVGDFGLAKSLVADAALTRTGAFIGTPLFASPEQIKGEATGPASDVYSVAATLYCLLTGKAPFHGGDSAATVARIVSDAAPPMRSLRPELPEALDRVVLRGLERDHDRRWRDLGELRAALLPLLPGQLSLVGLGVRFGAYWIDHFFLGLLLTPFAFLLIWQTAELSSSRQAVVATGNLLMGLLCFLLYFGLPEARWGWSPAKFCLGLRVVKAAGAERPELWRSLLRAGVFWTGLNLYGFGLWLLHLVGAILQPEATDVAMQLGLSLLTCCTFPLVALGPTLLVCTMRTRNGYRGLHEWLSGTRVVRLPEAEAGRTLGRRCPELLVPQPAGMPQQVGPFAVLGTVRDDGTDAVLLGEDAALGRKTLLWLRSADNLPLYPEQRAIARPSRLRWLAGGRQGDQLWDAFLFPAGHALPDVVATDGRLSWADTRYLLMQLADELVAAQSDGTLPWSLAIGQVWIQADGRLQLLDVPIVSADVEGDALPLLGAVAVLALEGKPRAATGRARVCAPLPEHAVQLLDRLVGPGEPYRKVRQLQKDLAAAADKPAAVNRRRRFAHLAVLAMFLYFGLSGLLMMMGFGPGTIVPVVGLIKLEHDEELLQHVNTLAVQDVVAALNTEPLTRGLALQQLQDDCVLRANVLKRLEPKRAEQDSRLRSANWAGRQFVQVMQKAMASQREALASASAFRSPSVARGAAQRVPAPDEPADIRVTCIITLSMLSAFLLMVAIYVAWDFVWRGGLTFRMLGLSLVRWDGRPAWRLQCAGRAILFWTPVATLIAAAVGLDCWYWATWTPDDSLAYVAWLSSITWWAGLALLPLYALLALRSPSRSLHDRLAGTYLVPR